MQVATLAPTQVGLIEAFAGDLHGLLVFWIAIGVQNHFNLVRVPTHATRLTVNQLRCFLQGQALPLRGKVVLFAPIVQIAQ